MPDLNHDLVRRIVREALEEDGAFQDVTTLTTVPPEQQGRGIFLAKDHGVLAGLPVAAAAFAAVDPAIVVSNAVEDVPPGERRTVVTLRPGLHDGAVLEPGTVIAYVEGPLAPILSAERVALNFLQRLSGVATATQRLTDAVAGLPVRVVDTRKTTPGLRALERYAVQVGGGQNHRFNLADGVLIKDNHVAAGRARGMMLGQVIGAARAGAPHTLRIEVEVTSYEEAREAVEARADVILLDNMTPAEMKRCVGMIAGRALTEASGGITAANARAIAESGVDIISSGALTHSAPALDISLEIEAS
jgi:nicotinate-nucleotide pyrophosphorylase (carboxylating)